MSPLDSFLDGVRVIDLTRHLPGPLATQLLSDMGAEVVKIEPPGGEEMRQIGPEGSNGRSVYFDAVNAGKIGLRLDLRAPDDRATFLELVEWADVLVHSFRPGVMERLDLADAMLAARNPRLIRCAITGYGETSPLRAAAGHDANYLALSGILDRNGQVGPAFFDPPVADVTAGLFANISILGALRSRDRTGRGFHLDLSLADAVMPLQAFQLTELDRLGHVPKRQGELLNGGAAFYQIYETADHRHMVVGAVEPKFWARFCLAAGRPDWVARQSDPMPQTDLRAELGSYFGAKTLSELLANFEAIDCCVSPILDLQEAVASEHHRTRGLLKVGEEGLQALFPVLVDEIAPSPRPSFQEADGARHILDASSSCPAPDSRPRPPPEAGSAGEGDGHRPGVLRAAAPAGDRPA
ncbi:CoA transferase [Phenylobacterium sp. LH3H17]|uniref:CaiB/BaiF CoA transferase family protein n=1 Tax=Phenylobacterium sp. LH3H17 TaxID=2903901 RepID=UPI0020C9F0D8|nr:CoA transferase [Phenylobacterium sp. LH3H17]UTP38286.1 CoA transferase [Phenylobacterium sp. LH3H17]